VADTVLEKNSALVNLKTVTANGALVFAVGGRGALCARGGRISFPTDGTLEQRSVRSPEEDACLAS
jgi:hypothetical protein